MKLISIALFGTLFSLCAARTAMACGGAGEERWMREAPCDAACQEAQFVASLPDCAKTPAYCAWKTFEHRLETNPATSKPTTCAPESACGKKRARLEAAAATENSPHYRQYLDSRAVREFQSGGCFR